MLGKKEDRAKTQLAKDFKMIKLKNSDFGNLSNFEEIDSAFERMRLKARQQLLSKVNGVEHNHILIQEHHQRPEALPNDPTRQQQLRRKSMSPMARFDKKVKLPFLF